MEEPAGAAKQRCPYRVSVLQIGSFDKEILDAERAWKSKPDAQLRP
jgi:hypothetical protein